MTGWDTLSRNDWLNGLLGGKENLAPIVVLTKCHIMYRVANNGKYDVLVTGENLGDEAASIFGNILNSATDYVKRKSPVLESTHPGLIRKAKAFCRFYGRKSSCLNHLEEKKVFI